MRDRTNIKIALVIYSIIMLFILITQHIPIEFEDTIVIPVANDYPDYSQYIHNSNGKYLEATTNNIQLALWDLNGTGGNIHLPETTYYINKTIIVPSNVTIRGNGAHFITNSTDLIGIIVNSVNTSISGLKIENCTVGIYLTENVKNCIITDCYLNNVDYGIVMNSSSHITITNCCIDYNIKAFSLTGTDIIMSDNVITQGE